MQTTNYLKCKNNVFPEKKQKIIPKIRLFRKNGMIIGSFKP